MRNRFLTRVTVVAIVACVAAASDARHRADAWLSRAACAGRQAESQWHLAGDQHGELGHRGALGRAESRAGTRGRGRSSRRSWCRGRRAPFRIVLKRCQDETRTARTGLKLDPEVKCYLPGRAASHLHAVSVSDHPEPEARHARSRVCRRGPDDLHGRSDRGTGR